MEEKLKLYFDRVRHLPGNKERATEMLRILQAENDYSGKQNKTAEHSLDKALNNFYIRKECRYIQQLLEHFILNDNFDFITDKNDTIYKLDRFKRIKELLFILLPDKLSFVANMKKSSFR